MLTIRTEEAQGDVRALPRNEREVERKWSTYLPCEGNRRLVEALLLGIANVAVDHLLEGKLSLVLLGAQLFVEFVGFDGELSADGVLDIENGRVEVGGSEGAHLASVFVKATEEEEGDRWGTGGRSSAGEREHLSTRLFERKSDGEGGWETDRSAGRDESGDERIYTTVPDRRRHRRRPPSTTLLDSLGRRRSQAAMLRAAGTGSRDDRTDMVVVGSSSSAHRSRNWPVAEAARTRASTVFPSFSLSSSSFPPAPV